MLDLNLSGNEVGMLRMGLKSGLLAGATVGLAEAALVLSTRGALSDLRAPLYALVLYGAVGVGMGAVVGVALTALRAAWRGLDGPRAWCLGALGVAAPLSLIIGRYALNKHVYAEAGVPFGVTLAMLAVVAMLGALSVGPLPRLMSMTPLRGLFGLRGTMTVYGAALLAAVSLELLPTPPRPPGAQRSPPSERHPRRAAHRRRHPARRSPRRLRPRGAHQPTHRRPRG